MAGLPAEHDPKSYLCLHAGQRGGGLHGVYEIEKHIKKDVGADQDLHLRCFSKRKSRRGSPS